MAKCRRPTVKRRLFDLDALDLNQNQLSPGKRQKVDETFLIEKEVAHLVRLKENLKNEKLRGKLRSPGSPKDPTAFRRMRPKIDVIHVIF